jgi:positive regulator of sigma E activity
MFERGIVRSVEGDRMEVLVAPRAPEACGSCGPCTETEEGWVLEVRTFPGAAPGTRVELEVPEESALGPAVVVFLLPVLAIVIGAALGQQIPEWGNWKSLPPLVGGLIGVIALLLPVLLVIRLYDRRVRRRAPRARVRRIIE